MMPISVYVSNLEKKEYEKFISGIDILDSLREGLAGIDINYLQEHKGCTLICGGMMSFDHGISSFINSWYEKDASLFLLSEVTAQFRRYTQVRINCPYCFTPHLLAAGIAPKNISIQHYGVYKDYCYNSKLMHIAEAQDALYAGSLGEGYSFAWTFYSAKFIEKILDELRPKEVVLWNEFYPFHKMFSNFCRKRGINVRYMEFGVIPGTFSIEEYGQMGNSELAVQTIAMQRRRVNQLDKAKQVLSYLRKTEANRYLQPSETDFVNEMDYEENRLIITFWGQNDEESGICPYNKESKRRHSCFFKSSEDAAKYLRSICNKNGWVFIYKPHPARIDRLGVPVINGVKTITKINVNRLIDYSDVNIVISSQMAYISLIRNKPVVLLGKNQLHKKKCAFEPWTKKGIEKAIKKAIRKGMSKRQKNNFLIHIADLLNMYLFDDLGSRNLRYGKNIEKE